ncbi:hypothetical protein LI90_4190 [Carbonactinospora thermoautotrophica]|uniref:Uncharacterized protein n=1 Tax=Carbonactinospora thermoautotrophica TaxID=1469144 RepID=A0A132MZP1_9ACTN|nr:tetratricopeptide repeat protein [Carbonactinospora thermoautotrophica]KWX03140.1 hypothetical protein LI90_4190 [Carbonactinospora thermoautotrophica]
MEETTALTVRQAAALLRMGQAAKAREILAKAVAAAPGHAEAWTLLARCELSLSSPEAALTAGQGALRADPGHTEAYWVTARARLDLGRPVQAERAATEAVRLDPARWYTHAVLAEARAFHPLPWIRRKALEPARRAVELGPYEPGAHIAAGVAAYRARRRRQARRHFEQALALDPTDDVALNNLALTDLARWRLGLAARRLMTSYTANPASPIPLHNLGVIAGRLVQAAQMLTVIGLIAMAVALAATDGDAVRRVLGGALLAAWALLVRAVVRLPRPARRWLARRVSGAGVVVWALLIVAPAGATLAAAVLPRDLALITVVVPLLILQGLGGVLLLPLLLRRMLRAVRAARADG